MVQHSSDPLLTSVKYRPGYKREREIIQRWWQGDLSNLSSIYKNVSQICLKLWQTVFSFSHPFFITSFFFFLQTSIVLRAQVQNVYFEKHEIMICAVFEWACIHVCVIHNSTHAPSQEGFRRMFMALRGGIRQTILPDGDLP